MDSPTGSGCCCCSLGDQSLA